MKKIFATAVLALLAACGIDAADIPIYPTGPVYSFPATSTGQLTWGISGPGGFNNNFYFVPLAVNESVCVFVKNNNTTSAHPFTGQITIQSDPSNTTPSDGTWQPILINGFNAPASPAQAVGMGAVASGVAKVAISFSNSTTLAGSPETANVILLQTQGNCFTGNQQVGSAATLVAAGSPLQTISEQLNQSFVSATTVTNPGAASNVLAVNSNNSTRNIYFDHVILTAGATAANLSLQMVNSKGTTCGAGSSSQINNIGFVSSSVTAVQAGACTVNPAAVGPAVAVNVPVNSSILVDLRGYIASDSATYGLEIINITAIAAGLVSAAFYWSEK